MVRMLVSPEASLLGMQIAPFSLCPHKPSSLCSHIPSIFSYKDTSHIVLGHNPDDLI